MSEIPYLGSRISLISKSENRYEGTLFTIDTKELAVALQNVQCFGTEGRLGAKGGTDVPPTNEVYEFIIFRASDIKDLHVCGPPRKGPTDPAIISQSAPSTPAQTASTISQPLQPQPSQQVQQTGMQQSIAQPQPLQSQLQQPGLLPQPTVPQSQPTHQTQIQSQSQSQSQPQLQLQPQQNQKSQPVQTQSSQSVEPKQTVPTELVPPSQFEKPQQGHNQRNREYPNRDNQYHQNRYHSQQTQQTQNQQSKYHQKPQYSRVTAPGPNQTNMSSPQPGQTTQRTYDYNNRKPNYVQGGYANRTYQNGNNVNRTNNNRGGRGGNQRFHTQRGRGASAGGRTPATPLEEFDFESSNAKFEKLKLEDDVKEGPDGEEKNSFPENTDDNEEKNENSEDEQTSSSNDQQKSGVRTPEKKSTVYDRKTSFYDSISCEATERQESEGFTSKIFSIQDPKQISDRKKQRSFSEQRKIDAETFGFATVYHGQHHNQNRPSGSGPSGRGRGGYGRGGYNNRNNGPRSGVIENL